MGDAKKIRKNLRFYLLKNIINAAEKYHKFANKCGKLFCKR